ncbi:hypothetical protein COBT_001078 [Conglomerata obtusa]
MSKTGRLIVLEGIDRSGKTSLAKRLSSALSKTHLTTTISFPNRKLITGQLIDAYLNNKIKLNPQTIHLLFSANRWEMNDEVKTLVSEQIVLCDRYCYSGIAYSAAKGLDLDWCSQPDKGIIVPDLIIFLDVKPEEVALRVGFGNEKYENVEYLGKVYALLKGLVQNEKNGLVVDANRNADEVFDEILVHIQNLI